MTQPTKEQQDKKRGAAPTSPPPEEPEVNNPTGREDQNLRRRAGARTNERKRLLEIAYLFSKRSLTPEGVVDELAALLREPSKARDSRKDVNLEQARYRELQDLAANLAARLSAIAREKLPMANAIVQRERRGK